MSFDNSDPELKAKQRAGRLAKNNGQYLSEEQKRRIVESVKARCAAMTHCKRGHAYAEHAIVYRGLRVCKICRALRKRQATLRRSGLDGPAVLKPGETLLSVQMRRSWERRRIKFGPSGLPAGTRKRVSAQHKARIHEQGHPMSWKTHCKRGHEFTTENTNVYVGPKGSRRVCRACVRLRNGKRPDWVMHKGVRVFIAAHDVFYRREFARLKAEMLAQHPDKNPQRRVKSGSFRGAGFVKARKALVAFEQREKAWYREVGLSVPTPPKERRRRSHEEAVEIGKRAWATRMAKLVTEGTNEVQTY